MGGLWGSGTALELYLKEEGLKTLLFSGVNTDQVHYLRSAIQQKSLTSPLRSVSSERW
jgi:nicotinamidase-related amidase